jgi:hypothetical protein
MGMGVQLSESKGRQRVISHNARGLQKDAYIEEFVAWFEKLLWVLCACLQETWRLGMSVEENRGHVFLNSGPDAKLCKRGSLGLTIVIHRNHVAGWKEAGKQLNRYGLRVMSTRINVWEQRRRQRRPRRVTVYVVNGYAPDSSKPEAEKAAYATHLQEAINDCKANEILVIGTDANASPGVRSVQDDPFAAGRDKVRGPFGMPHENKAGKELCTLLGVNELCLASTYFQHKEYATWTHPCSGKKHQLDHVIVQQKHLRSVTNAGRIGLPGKDSDHFAVFVELRIARNLKRKSPPMPPTIRIKRPRLFDRGGPLRKDSVSCGPAADDFVTATGLMMTFVQQLPQPKHRASILQHFHMAMRAAAEDVLEDKDKRRPGWYEAAQSEIAPAISARNTAQFDFNRLRTALTHERLKLARKSVKRAVKRAEQCWLEKIITRIEGRGAIIHPADAWKAIRELRDGKLVTKKVVSRWSCASPTAARPRLTRRLRPS